MDGSLIGGLTDGKNRNIMKKIFEKETAVMAQFTTRFYYFTAADCLVFEK